MINPNLACHSQGFRLLAVVGKYCVSAVLLSLLPHGGTVARAQSDNFNGGNDTAWTHYDPFSGFGAPATYSFPGGGYRIQSALSPSPGTLGPSRAGSLRTDQTYTDFSVSYDLVDWNNSLNQAFGVLGRVTNPGLGTTDGYALTYSTGGSIDISRITGEAPTGLGSFSVTLNPANDYRFVFTGTGNTLAGQVFDLSDLSTPLATVTSTDSTYGSGINGFVVFDNSGAATADATFDNYVATVPEPSSLALLVAGGVGLMLFRRRSSKSSR